MKRWALITLVMLLMGSLFVASASLLRASEAGTPTEIMRTGNQLYEQGQYAQAALVYEQLIDQGYSDSALYYNLGNVYYRQGEYGRAILNYRRAQQLAPRDADIETNLALARDQVMDRVEVAEEAGVLRPLGEMLQRWVTLNELAMVALAAWMAVLFLSALLLGAPKHGAWHAGVRYTQIAALGLLLVAGLFVGSYLYAERSAADGVVVAEQVAVNSGPGLQYVTEFSLHSGAEVRLVDVQGSWARLSLPGGDLDGWVPANAIEPVS
jgi:tetratricopeptide (TPR) repeat protein